jgi:hypothetical protein
MMASSLDIVIRDASGDMTYHRHLLPFLKIGSTNLSAVGKAYCLLWQLWLCFGPSGNSLQYVLSNIVGLCTDLGTERMLASVRNILPQFARQHGLTLAPQPQMRDRLFEYALPVPGWQHIIDSILRRLLSSQKWWPTFLKSVKAFCKLIRIHGADLVKELKRLGVSGAASVVQQVRGPTFAAWRWGTLFRAVQAAFTIFPVLRDHWSSLVFHKNLRDTVLTKTIGSSIQDPKFYLMAGHVRLISGTANRLASWGCGCECHSALGAQKSTPPLQSPRRRQRSLHAPGPRSWAGRSVCVGAGSQNIMLP